MPAGKKVTDFTRGNMDWYYSKNASQYGPVPEDELKAKIATGEVGPADLVWKDGMRDWTPSGSVPELAARTPMTPAGYDTSGHSRNPEPPAQTPYQTPASTGVPTSVYVATPPTSGLAIASLVCGIMGLVTCLCLPGIPAVVCGHMALSRIAEAQGRLGGRGLAIAGLVTGYLSVVILVIFVLMIFVGFTTNPMPVSP